MRPIVPVAISELALKVPFFAPDDCVVHEEEKGSG